jgi:hypothetical protein
MPSVPNENPLRTCRHFGISRQCFYIWKRAYERDGEAGLVNKKPCPQNVALRTPRGRDLDTLLPSKHLSPPFWR